MACSNCNDNSTPQPCCQDCPDTNPCQNGCLDFIDASCVEYTSALPTCISVSNGSKLDFIIRSIDSKLCDLEQRGDKYVRITSLDPSSAYLSDKITTCDFLTKEVITSGGQQKLKLCINSEKLISVSETNPIIMDLDGLNINYTLLVETIANDPDLVQLLCNVISGCTPD